MQVVRGFLMGSADIIPGVSGGTIALILGIYARLVTAIATSTPISCACSPSDSGRPPLRMST